MSAISVLNRIGDGTKRAIGKIGLVLIVALLASLALAWAALLLWMATHVVVAVWHWL